MVFTHKLAALAVSTSLLLGGGTAAIVAATAAPEAPIAATATPAPVTTDVRVVADNQTHLVSLVTPTVAEALAAAGVALGPVDRADKAPDAVLAAGEAVTVARVSVTQETKVVTLDFSTVRKNDASLDRGATKVQTKGVAGERTDVVETVTVDGQVESENVVQSTTTQEPIAQVVLVGTKAPEVTSRSTTRPAAPTATSGAGINLANAAMWDRIAQCESTGNWSINTGNGYYGGLQFSLASWKANGGTDFAAYPHQASRAEQITVANRYYAKAGLAPWGCRGSA